MESISDAVERLLGSLPEDIDMVIKDEPKEAIADNRDAIKRGAKLAVEHWRAKTGQPMKALAVKIGKESSQVSRLLASGATFPTDLFMELCAAAGIDWEAAMTGRVEQIAVSAQPYSTATAAPARKGESPFSMLAKLIGTPHEHTIRVVMEDLLNRNN